MNEFHKNDVIDILEYELCDVLEQVEDGDCISVIQDVENDDNVEYEHVEVDNVEDHPRMMGCMMWNGCVMGKMVSSNWLMASM